MVETVTLNNGVQMPVSGYGTYQTQPGITEPRLEEPGRSPGEKNDRSSLQIGRFSFIKINQLSERN